MGFLRLRCNVKPLRGPFHFRAPSKIFWRTVRGMVPHKSERGKEALKASDVRGNPAPLRQEEEDGHTFCPPGAQAQAWQEVLLARPSVARGRMEVPRRRRDVGGEAPRQGRGVLQKGIGRSQNPAAGAQGRQGRQEDRTLQEDHRELRIRVTSWGDCPWNYEAPQ